MVFSPVNYFVSRPDNLVVLKFSSDEGASINTTLEPFEDNKA